MRVELWALARGPILLLDVDLVRLLHAVTFHDNLVGMAFELHSEQNGVECHLVARDAADAESVEEFLSALSVSFDEDVVGRFPSEPVARVAVDVRHREVHVLLHERVERRPVLEDAPDFAVIAFDVRFLARAVGIAVEQADAAGNAFRRVVDGIGSVELDAVGIAELGPVVRDDDREDLAGKHGARDFPGQVDDPRAGLCCSGVAEKGEHQPAVVELEREQHLSPDLSDDGVHLDDGEIGVGLAVGDQLVVRPSDAAFRVRLRLGLPRFGFSSSGERKVARIHVEEPGLDVSVDGAFRDALEDFRVAGHHVSDGLVPENAGREDLVHLGDTVVVGMDAASGFPERPRVVRLCAVRDVEPLLQRAGVESLASVADVGRAPESRADGLPELGADREALRRRSEEPLRVVSVSPDSRTGVVVRADAVGASVSAADPDPAVGDFPLDRRVGSSPVGGYLRDRPSQSEQEFNPASVVSVHVFRHVGFPFAG